MEKKQIGSPRNPESADTRTDAVKNIYREVNYLKRLVLSAETLEGANIKVKELNDLKIALKEAQIYRLKIEIEQLKKL